MNHCPREAAIQKFAKARSRSDRTEMLSPAILDTREGKQLKVVGTVELMGVAIGSVAMTLQRRARRPSSAPRPFMARGCHAASPVVSTFVQPQLTT